MNKKLFKTSAGLLCALTVLSACGYHQAGNDNATTRANNQQNTGLFGARANNQQNTGFMGTRGNANVNNVMNRQGGQAVTGISSFLESHLASAGIPGIRVLVLGDTVILGQSLDASIDRTRGAGTAGYTGDTGARGTGAGMTGGFPGGVGRTGFGAGAGMGAGTGAGTGAGMTGGFTGGVGRTGFGAGAGMGAGTGAGTGAGMTGGFTGGVGRTGFGAGAGMGAGTGAGMTGGFTGGVGRTGFGAGAGMGMGTRGAGIANTQGANVSDIEYARNLVRGVLGNNVQVFTVFSDRAIQAMDRVRSNFKDNTTNGRGITADIQTIMNEAMPNTHGTTGDQTRKR